MSWDALVAGGGPAGAAAGAFLAAGGARVLVAERSTGPHQKVCGEFLSHEAAAVMRRLGVDPAALGALPIARVRLAARGVEAAADLPFPAWSLGRDRMDEALLDAARAHGARVRRGVLVRSLDLSPGGARATVGEAVEKAGAALLATGKHDLRGHRRPDGGGAAVIGFKQHWRLAPAQARALDGHVEVHLFAGGYAGLQPAAGGRANLCLVVDAGRYAALGRDWAALLAHAGRGSPLLAERLAGGAPCWPRPLAVAGIPYGFRHGGGEGPHRLGDQLAVIPSFCGDGMAIALDSGRRAAERVLAGLPPGDAGPYRGQVELAHAASRAMAVPLLPVAAVAVARAVPGALRWFARRTRVGGACA